MKLYIVSVVYALLLILAFLYQPYSTYNKIDNYRKEGSSYEDTHIAPKYLFISDSKEGSTYWTKGDFPYFVQEIYVPNYILMGFELWIVSMMAFMTLYSLKHKQ